MFLMQGGSYLTAIIYSSITSSTQYFYSADPQLASNSISGRQLVFFAVLDANNNTAQAGSMEIIEKEWINKNVVYYNATGKQLKIPLKYISGTTSISFAFFRVNGTSSENDNIANGQQTLSGNANQYISLGYNIQSVNPGVFNFQIDYVGSSYIEYGQFDLTKMGNWEILLTVAIH